MNLLKYISNFKNKTFKYTIITIIYLLITIGVNAQSFEYISPIQNEYINQLEYIEFNISNNITNLDNSNVYIELYNIDNNISIKSIARIDIYDEFPGANHIEFYKINDNKYTVIFNLKETIFFNLTGNYNVYIEIQKGGVYSSIFNNDNNILSFNYNDKNNLNINTNTPEINTFYVYNKDNILFIENPDNIEYCIYDNLGKLIDNDNKTKSINLTKNQIYYIKPNNLNMINEQSINIKYNTIKTIL